MNERSEPGFDALRDAPPPEAARVFRRVARRRSRRRWAGLAAGVAAALVLVVAVRPAAMRDRGIDTLPLVALHAVAEGPDGARALSPGAVVAPEERVVFFVTSSDDGWARLTEGGAPVYPTAGTWRVSAGESVPGGAVPLAWRPDRPVPAARYAVEVCPEPDAAPARCGRAELGLRWAP